MCARIVPEIRELILVHADSNVDRLHRQDRLSSRAGSVHALEQHQRESGTFVYRSMARLVKDAHWHCQRDRKHGKVTSEEDQLKGEGECSELRRVSETSDPEEQKLACTISLSSRIRITGA